MRSFFVELVAEAIESAGDRNVHVEPRCQGAAGAVLNFVAPFLTKSYSDVALLAVF